MKRIIIGFLIWIFAIFCGAAFGLYQILHGGAHSEFMLYNGPWRVNPNMDLKDPFQRAFIARYGLFALRESEVIYYTATMDSEGIPLTSKHDYILEGSIPEARYWSYTLYGEDNFLISNEDKIYGYNQETLFYTPLDSIHPELKPTIQKTYQILISSERKKKNWLPSGDNGQLAITLRLYNPSKSVYENLESIPLPEIRRLK